MSGGQTGHLHRSAQKSLCGTSLKTDTELFEEGAGAGHGGVRRCPRLAAGRTAPEQSSARIWGQRTCLRGGVWRPGSWASQRAAQTGVFVCFH